MEGNSRGINCISAALNDVVDSIWTDQFSYRDWLARNSPDQSLDMLEEWEKCLEDQRVTRRATLAKFIVILPELNGKGVAPSTMAATVVSLGDEFEHLDHDMMQVMATGVRHQTFRPSSNGGTDGLSAGPGAVQPPNVGSAHCTPVHPAPTAGGNPAGAGVSLQELPWRKTVPVPIKLPLLVPRGNDQDKSKYKLCCVICNQAFRNHQAVFTHFLPAAKERECK